MRNLEIDSQTTLSHILSELKATEEDGLELSVVPGERSLLDNEVNKRIINKVAKAEKKEVVFPVVPIEKAPEVEPDDMGFVEGEDVVAKAPIENVHDMMQPPAVTAEVVTKNPKSSKIAFQKILKNKLFWLGAGLLALVLLFWLAFFFLPSSEVKISAKTESKDSQLTLVGDSDAKEFSVKDNIIPVTTTTVSKEASEEAATTGKKTIGTNATGRVTITNQDTTSAKTFTAGTILTLTTNANITFKLDSTVSIEQAPVGGEKTAGVNVTATKAGTEGNLAEGSVFKVGNSPEFLVFAKNDVAFSGGSSKLANVASAEDREALKNSIIEKLEEEAKKEIEGKQKDVVVVEDSFEIKVTSESYEPKAVDAEAENLKATIAISATAVLVEKDGLKKLVVEKLAEGNESFKVAEENLNVTLTQTGVDSAGKRTITAKVKAQLVPEIAEAEIKRNLAGKSTSQAAEYLDSIDEIAGYEVKSQPFYFRLIGRLPFSQDKIKIKFEE